ncbi:sugar phosphate nucleotidyltransferase [Hoeflea alexandrii]|uniref:sugar phosphate nucleotidyltransferase n=1 Tax=Hoeflea alexandrii TaxID=288436 RepID=UPI00226F0E2D|nr:sugar phosphate nucleotidyltransferase [Hoeflea alexandrii]MCY0151640.1 sugar phosphate nucleotidyltransferase [Hoeflea alexandrii]
MSRDSKPKQFHKLVNDKTLLTNTLERVDHKGEGLRYLPTRIVGGIAFESLLTEQGETGSVEVERYVLEPLIRDTAAAIAASIADLAKTDPDRMVLVLPSDHQISDAGAFFGVIRTGARALAERGGIMTIGIAPTRPETQYGYIERGDGDGPVYDVSRFREKPDLETAETFLRSGRFFWNAEHLHVPRRRDGRRVGPAAAGGLGASPAGRRTRRYRGQMLPARSRGLCRQPQDIDRLRGDGKRAAHRRGGRQLRLERPGFVEPAA